MRRFIRLKYLMWQARRGFRKAMRPEDWAAIETRTE